jgi:diguanylate cyclase (GGDEF)-like protein/PAS domain S-box-containing protein
MQAELAALTAEREQKNAALQESEERYRLLFDTSLDAIILTNQEGGVQSANRAACRLLDRTEDEIRQLGRSGLMDMHDPRLAKALDERAKTGKFFGELTMIRRDGSPFPVEISSTQFRASDGTLRSSLIIRDISERQQVEQNLRIAATAFESQEGMTVADAQGVVLRVNKAFTEITGYSESDMVGQTHRILHSGQQDPAFYVAMWDSITRTGAWQGEIWNRRKSGEAFPVFLSVTAVKGDDGSVTHYVGAFTDITQRKVAEDEITQLAFYDQLTRLPNRRLMLDRLQQALTISARRECHGALMMVDLDNFKSLNDTFGHAAGDLLLVEVAARLKSTIREGDTVARLGGDEFVVILKDLESSGDQAAVQAQVVANSIQTRLAQPYWLEVSTDGAAPDLRSHHCTSSTGVALFFDQSVTVDELMKRADTAMYQAKAVGRNTLCFFDPQMQAVVKARATLELDLHKAVESGQFVLHYQPQLASSGRVIGAEALVRWQHPQRGLVAPGEFIPLAEETGLILQLGYWVLESACIQLAVWATQPALAHLDLAVNVSACQFGVVDFVAQVKTVLARTQAPAHRLKLELTESLLLDNTSVIVTRMAELKTLGVSFSIDDFGTGYSSLAYLKRLPLDQLKIDQSFVRDILTDPNDAAIAKTIIALAQTMGMSVIAEGVETVQQRDFLTACGCLAYQGYLFSRPLPLEAFEVFVHRKNGQA